MNRILIRRARLLDLASGLDALGDLLVEGERIAAVGGNLSGTARDAETVMAEGLCLAPGLVDMRAQLREPVLRTSYPTHPRRISRGLTGIEADFPEHMFSIEGTKPSEIKTAYITVSATSIG